MTPTREQVEAARAIVARLDSETSHLSDSVRDAIRTLLAATALPTEGLFIQMPAPDAVEPGQRWALVETVASTVYAPHADMSTGRDVVFASGRRASESFLTSTWVFLGARREGRQ